MVWCVWWLLDLWFRKMLNCQFLSLGAKLYGAKLSRCQIVWGQPPSQQPERCPCHFPTQLIKRLLLIHPNFYKKSDRRQEPCFHCFVVIIILILLRTLITNNYSIASGWIMTWDSICSSCICFPSRQIKLKVLFNLYFLKPDNRLPQLHMEQQQQHGLPWVQQVGQPLAML